MSPQERTLARIRAAEQLIPERAFDKIAAALRGLTLSEQHLFSAWCLATGRPVTETSRVLYDLEISRKVSEL